MRTEAPAAAIAERDDDDERDEDGGHGSISHSSARRTESTRPLHALDDDRVADHEIVLQARPCPPERAVDEDLAERGRRAAHHADVADEALDAGPGPRAPDRERGARDDRQQRQRGERDEDDHGDDEQRPAARAVDRERGAGREGDDAGEAQRAVRGQVGLGDQETCADGQQHDAQEDHGSQAIVAPRGRGIAGSDA